MTRQALIVGSAPVGEDHTYYLALIKAADLLIAADGGLALCLEAGRMPDVCVGDFDSVSPADLQLARAAGSEIRVFPAEKDASDLDLAVEAARSRAAGTLRITAAFTGRIDHTLAAFGALLRAADLGATALEPAWQAHALDAASTRVLELAEQPGTVVSLFALGECAVVSAEGVRFPLREARLEPVSSLGLSNVASARTQRIEVHQGRLIAVINSASG